VGCSRIVERQKRVFLREQRFRCAEHSIYISPSTYDHEDYRDNLFLDDDEDCNVLEQMLRVKRETGRLSRERSADALTFNVFRTLELEGLLPSVVSRLSGSQVLRASLSYWSFSLSSGTVHPLLKAARKAFGEVEERGSEPDIIVETDSTLVLIEAKLDSRNETTPSRPWVLETYRRAEKNWYDRVFQDGPVLVAREHKLYQLMRLWLLGTWMANRAGKGFALVSLTPASCDEDLVSRFGPHILASEGRAFGHFTWEEIREEVRPAAVAGSPVARRLVEYLDHKTLGYDRVGQLRLAFDAQESR